MQDKYIKIDRLIFDNLKVIRTKISTPITKFLSIIGFTSNRLSLFRLILMFVFFYYLSNLKVAFWILVITLLLDNFDGALARLQKDCSDYGKFIDMIIDQLVESIFIIGLIFIGVAQPTIAAIFIVLSFLMVTFTIIDYKEYNRSDWLFKPRMSIIEYIPRISIYVAFLFLVFFQKNPYTILLILSSIFMAVMAIYHFYKLSIKYKVRH